MKNLIQAAVVTLFAASAAHAQQAVQWKVSDGGNGHWYQLVRTGKNAQHWFWSTAAAAANARGAHLVTFSSDFESSAVYLRLGLATATNCVAWIGFMQIPGSAEPGGGWRWVTMEPTEFLNWKPGYPDDSGCSIAGEHQDFAVIGSGGDPRWDDSGDPTAECPYGVPFAVIEYDADCNQDGIIDYGQCHDGTLPDYNGNNIPDCCEQGAPCVTGDYPVQWRVEARGNGHWYQIDRTPGLGWYSARDRASLKNGALASVTTFEENEFVGTLIGNITPGPGYWLGAYVQSGAWHWLSGEPWNFTSWGGPANGCTWQQPSGRDAVDIYCIGNDGVPHWSDDYFAWPNAVGLVIEWSADCNSDGVVDYGQILDGELPDTNGNGIPDCCDQGGMCCVGDIFHDGRVNGGDLGIMLSYWGAATTTSASQACDLNHDSRVDGSDLGLLLSNWGPCQH